MSKLYILRGLPASGKSTKAKEIIEQSGNTVRINKDLIRTMLHFDKWSGGNEKMTRRAAMVLAEHFLNEELNVIIDDTNLNENTLQSWKDLASRNDHTFEVMEMDTPWQDCTLRDSEREKPVGSTVIKNMGIQNGIITFQPDSVVICDIDGTIADCSHRQHYLEGEKKDWKGFFSEMDKDPVRLDVATQLVKLYDEGKAIIFVSARPEDYKKVTLDWLAKNYLSFAFTLIMRRSGDKRPDTEVKEQILNTYFPDKSVIHKVIDDRPSVIRMWRENGLTVEDVGAGKEF